MLRGWFRNILCLIALAMAFSPSYLFAQQVKVEIKPQKATTTTPRLRAMDTSNSGTTANLDSGTNSSYQMSTSGDSGSFVVTAAKTYCCGGLFWRNIPPLMFNFVFNGINQAPMQAGMTAEDLAQAAIDNPDPAEGWYAIYITVTVTLPLTGNNADPPCSVDAFVDSSKVASATLDCTPSSDTNMGECPDCGGGKPIDFASGNVSIQQTDIAIPGLGGGLQLTRTWNSMQPMTSVGRFGARWSSNFEERVAQDANGNVLYYRSDGSIWTFAFVSQGTYSLNRPKSESATLTSGSSNWTMTFKTGEHRYFDTKSGLLKMIEDRNHNTTAIAYDATNRLSKVTDPAGRSLYFKYGGDDVLACVTEVTSDVGMTVHYSYVANDNRLIKEVTEPDGSVLKFEYDRNYLITSVKDARGKVIESHTYTSFYGKGLSSSRADGVESMTVEYSSSY